MFVSLPLFHCILWSANRKNLAKCAKARVSHSFAERSVSAIMAEEVVESHILGMVLREGGEICVGNQGG